MRKYLITKDGYFYKANLHCHTNISDGKFSPEQVKTAYKNKGYSVIAFTDHDVFVNHDDLTDEKFLALNGYEMEFNHAEKPTDNSRRSGKKTAHFCFIALDKNMKTPCCLHREKYYIGNSKKYVGNTLDDPSIIDFEREYSPECINTVIERCAKAGFFVTYNHPTWSIERYYDYINYKGMNAMEIVNGECRAMGYDEYNPRVYDDFLDVGNKIYCIATDDNHTTDGMFVGWTMIKAPKLEYNEITKALLEGNFYASEGPEIKDLYVEDGYLCIETSPAREIMFQNSIRRAIRANNEDGKPVTFAKFPIFDNDGFVRITVIDNEGKHANTNAYDAKEILK